jgi:hypothetical protein
MNMKPQSGYYRQLLKNDFPDVRIAFTHTPIYGCTKVDADPILKILDNSEDPYAKFYSNGLRDGSLVTIVENSVSRVYKNNGELYFTT